jgi:hypothetical protein
MHTKASSLVLAPGDQLGKILIILCVGMVATLLFTAQSAVTIRSIVKTENKEVRLSMLRWLCIDTKA